MLDDAVMEGWCPCPMCRLARRRGIRGDMHRYDDIHAEDVSWSFKVFCRCCRCREVRRTLAQRVIRA